MIRTYGLFWKVDDVFWGKQRNPGSLLGSKSQSPKAVAVDFRGQRGIYALYGDYELVYIGQTGAGKDRLFDRLKFHLSDHLVERWNRFSWFGTQWVTKEHRLSTDNAAVHEFVYKALNTLEAVAIAVAEPRLNLQRGRWGAAKQYYQVHDPRLDQEPI
ncbi:MAG: GIY-YIG nuclease family protein [Sedimentisphaerales bacterium]|nr:GIY-YIG nuclease family protein [Sedimentisphaerales bacterium]